MITIFSTSYDDTLSTHSPRQHSPHTPPGNTLYACLPTHHAGDEAEVTRHDVLKVVCDEHSSYIKLDLVRGLGVVLEHFRWSRLQVQGRTGEKSFSYSTPRNGQVLLSATHLIHACIHTALCTATIGYILNILPK